MSGDDDYYRRRERQERESAERAEDTGARRIHLEMAARYQEKIRQAVAAPPVQAGG